MVNERIKKIESTLNAIVLQLQNLNATLSKCRWKHARRNILAMKIVRVSLVSLFTSLASTNNPIDDHLS